MFVGSTTYAPRGSTYAWGCGYIDDMTVSQAESARQRWASTKRTDRAAATRAAVAASTERRKLAHDVLRALEGAGLVVTPRVEPARERVEVK